MLNKIILILFCANSLGCVGAFAQQMDSNKDNRISKEEFKECWPMVFQF